jgi:putative ABC transport system permease protein
MDLGWLAGREFLAADRQRAPQVLILNQSMARRLFGEQNPVGHMLRFHDEPPTAIEGVVKDSKYFSLSEKDLSAVFGLMLNLPVQP